MGKHAYLIMCHNNLPILKKLVDVLDDSRNDIYIHIDRKVREIDRWQEEIETKESSVFFTKRVNVNWGGYSQIKAELLLLETAVRQRYDYYHLLSGVDMPLKNQNEIHEFFEKNAGKEYIGIDEQSENGKGFAARLQYYRFLQDKIGRNPGLLSALLERIEDYSLKIQRVAGVDRLGEQAGMMYKGPQWFSITHHLAMHVLMQRKMIRKRYQHCLCADEIFMQTIVMNSPYRGNIVNDCLRYIDWERGSPYTFTTEDYSLLMDSGKMFARKFDEKVDFQIVEKIWESIKQ